MLLENSRAYHCTTMRVEGTHWMWKPAKPRKKSVKETTYTQFHQTKITHGWVMIVLCSELEKVLFEAETLSNFLKGAMVSKFILYAAKVT